MTQQIQEMLRLLRPVLKDWARAEQILIRFWNPRIALVWTVKEVHTAANERERALTNAEALTVLQQMRQRYNRQYGLKWSDFTNYIEESGLGRKMTKAEIDQFVKQDRLTIAQS